MIADDIARKITETAARIAKYEKELYHEKNGWQVMECE